MAKSEIDFAEDAGVVRCPLKEGTTSWNVTQGNVGIMHGVDLVRSCGGSGATCAAWPIDIGREGRRVRPSVA
jgi:hypothetical protein